MATSFRNLRAPIVAFWRSAKTPGERLGVIVGLLLLILPALIWGAVKGAIAGLRRPIKNGR